MNKELIFKPLLVLVMLAAAGVGQSVLAQKTVATAISVPSPSVAATPETARYPEVSHVYADAAAPTDSASAAPTAAASPLPVTAASNSPSAPATITSKQPPSALPTPAITAHAQLAGAVSTGSPAVPGYSVRDGNLYDASGHEVVLHGVNWFGFDTTAHVVHGLWSRNWQSMVTQIKSTGFNAVRLPVCPATLDGAATGSGLIDYSLNPDLAGLNGRQVLDKVVNAFNAQGTYVLLDFHSADCQTISDLWYTSSYSESQWISDLTGMAASYSSLPYFLGIDLKNEPQGTATWGTGNAATDWNLAADRAGAAVLAANPNLLVFVEGVQNNPTCSSTTAHFWGGNLEPAACTPLTLPADKTVYSPHVYGPDVYMQPYFSASNFPANMPAIWTQQFGFLAAQGAAVVPGEWGGRYGTGGGTSLDVSWQNALTSYYEQQGICSSFYWSWNPNSGDTGGVLENDWQTVWPQKAALLTSYWNSCK